MISRENQLQVYDVRYPAQPYLAFEHLCDENALNVLGVSEVYDPFNTDSIKEEADLFKLLDYENLENVESQRLLYGFGTMKNASALLFPNKVFEKFATAKDKYFELGELDEYLVGLKALGLKSQDFSYLNFENYNHPKMLYTSNICDHYYKIRGLNVVHFGKDLVTICLDSANNLIFQTIQPRENGDYEFLKMIHSKKKKSEETEELNEWTHFNRFIKSKVQIIF
jgi:hypothetical protein